MDFSRIGEKVINNRLIDRKIAKIIKLRSRGLSQSEVAAEVNVERSFISRLESIGTIRKGQKIALVGFPVANKKELSELAGQYGVEYVLLMTEEERWDFIQNKSGLELFNEIIEIMVKLKEFDLLIFLGSDMRLDLIEKLMEGEIIGIELGESPITENKHVDINEVEAIISSYS